MDVYTTNIHAFDILKPSLDISKEAIKKFDEHFSYAKEHYLPKISNIKNNNCLFILPEV